MFKVASTSRYPSADSLALKYLSYIISHSMALTPTPLMTPTLVSTNPGMGSNVLKCPLCIHKGYSTSRSIVRATTSLRKHLLSDHGLEISSVKKAEILAAYFRGRYDPEQLDFITSPVDDCCLAACPGSGKTHSCIGLVTHLFRVRGWDHTNVIALMFSREAQAQFQRRAKDALLGEFATTGVKTIHKLATSVLVQLTGKKSESVDTVVAAATHHITSINADIFAEKCPRLSKLRLIIVDEAQDISASQHKFILALRQIVPGASIYMVGDTNQNIMQFQGGSDSFLRNHAPNNKKYLVRNYRSTTEIIDFANQHRPWKETPAMVPGGVPRHGPKPTWYTHSDRQAAIDAVVQEVLECEGQNVAVIGPFKVNSKTGEVNKHCIGLNSILDTLRANHPEVKCEVGYVLGDRDESKTVAVDPENATVLFTIHGSKGLEFDRVILVDFHFRTFKSRPSLAQHRRHEYLWFVGMTRAKNTLSMHSVVHKGASPWTGMKECDPNTYTTMHQGNVNWGQVDFNNEEPRMLMWSVTDFLSEMKQESWTEEQRLVFQNLVSFEELTTNTLWHDTSQDHKLLARHSALCGVVAHYTVEAAYICRHRPGEAPSFIHDLQSYLSHALTIPDRMRHSLEKLQEKLGQTLARGLLRVSDLKELMPRFKKPEQSLVEYVIERRSLDDKVMLRETSPLYWHNEEELRTICEALAKPRQAVDGELQALLFKVGLYHYQKANNLAYLWGSDESESLFQLLQPYMGRIAEWVSKSSEFLSKDWQFEVAHTHPCTDLRCRVDAIDPDGNIVEFKFSHDDFGFYHKLQALLNYDTAHPDWRRPRMFKLVNLRKGVMSEFSFSADRKRLLLGVARTTKSKLRNMCFVYDLETTGVNPMFDEIIDRHFYEPLLDLVVSSGLVRPQCLPLSDEIVRLTGIHSGDLIKAGVPYVERVRQELVELLEACESPVLIAHNGSHFDHKILCVQGFVKDNESVRFLDSRFILRLLPGKFLSDDESLAGTYHRVVGRPWVGPTHRAEADVEILVAVLRSANILNTESIQQLATNAKTFFGCN